MGTILYLVGLVCAVLAVLDIFKKNISTVHNFHNKRV